MIRQILFVIFLIVANISDAAEPLSLNPSAHTINLVSDLTVLPDSSKTLPIEDVIDLMAGEQARQDLVVSGNRLPPLSGWVKFHLVNHTHQAQKWVLNADNARIGTLYISDDANSQSVSKVGKTRFLSLDESFIISIAPNQDRVVYLYYLSVYTSKLELIEFTRFIESNPLANFFQFGYLGTIFAILLINIYLYSTTRYSRYFYYCFYLFSVTLTSYVRYLQSQVDADIIWLQYISLILPSISALLFMIVLLETRTRAPLIHRFAQILIGLFVLSLVLYFYFLEFVRALSPILAALLYVCLIMGGLITWRRGLALAKWYLLAWSGFIFFASYATFSRSILFYQPGVIFECIVISLILASMIKDRQRQLIEEKHIRQQTLLSFDQMRRDLEHRVRERSESLMTANTQLQASILELNSKQTELIRLKKLEEIGKLLSKLSIGSEHNIERCYALSTQIAAQISTLEKHYLRKSLTKKQLEAGVEFIAANVPRLVHSFNGACDLIETFKKIAVQENEDELTTFPLSAYVKNLTKKLYQNESEFECRFHADQNVLVESYPSVIFQIITRLVENAKQHAFAGVAKPVVDISVEAQNENVLLKVADNGTGVAAAVLPQICDAFYSGQKPECDGESNKNEDGEHQHNSHGLGLHIVKNLVVHKLKGSMQLYSDAGQGLAIEIQLPSQLSTATGRLASRA